MAWMQSGISQTQKNAGQTEWNKGDRTNFKSSLYIEDADGKRITYDKKEDGMPMWDKTANGYTLIYEIQTLSDGKGKSDKVQVDIFYTNWKGFYREQDLVLDSLTPEQLESYERGSPTMKNTVAKMTEQAMRDKNIPWSITIYNKQVDTGSDGKYTESIPIEDNWAASNYAMTIHYGYQGDKEESYTGGWTGGLFQSNWGKSIKGIAFGVAFVALLAIPGGQVAAGLLGGGAAFAGTWTAIAIGNVILFGSEVVAMLAYEAIMGRYGPATENKYGDSFPMMGFTHPYGFNVFPAEALAEYEGQTVGGILSDPNLTPMEKAEKAFNENKAVQTILGVAVLLMFLKIVRGR